MLAESQLTRCASGTLKLACPCGMLLVWRPQEGQETCRCRRCHTVYPLLPTGRPPIIARCPDGARLYCPCGMVLLWESEQTAPPRQCGICKQRYRWPGDPEDERTPAQPEQREAPSAAANTGLPVCFLTDLVCLLCGHLVARVRHQQPDYIAEPAHLRMRCQTCGGNPVRDDTHPVFTFFGGQTGVVRPFGL